MPENPNPKSHLKENKKESLRNFEELYAGEPKPKVPPYGGVKIKSKHPIRLKPSWGIRKKTPMRPSMFFQFFGKSRKTFL